MKDLHTTLACLGFVIVLLAFFERKTKRAPTSEPLLALIFGILFGPDLLNWINPSSWGPKYEIFHIATSFTLALALMATALRLPKRYFLEKKKSLVSILTGGMFLMWTFSSLIIWALTGLPFLMSVLIGAIVTPTDPVVASSIVSGKVAQTYLPDRMRHFISAESGANDGLAYCFAFLPLYLMTKTTELAWSEWFFNVLLWQNLVGILIGLSLGLIAGALIQRSLKSDVVSEKAFYAFAIALGIMSYGMLELIHCNGVVGVFATGLGVNHYIKGNEAVEAEKVEESMERLFTIPIFVLLGATLPWDLWVQMGWLAVAIPLAILFFRRMPMIFLLKRLLPELRTKGDRWFAGWFGPVGVAALYYASVSYKKLLHDELWSIPTLVIVSSVLIHGVTSFPLMKKYSGISRR